MKRSLILALGTCLLVHVARDSSAAPAPAAAPEEPLARAASNRVKLWEKAGTGAHLTARYRMTRRSSLLFEPLSTQGSLRYAPGTLELKDDERTGATTQVTGDVLQIAANDPGLPAGPASGDGSAVRRWLHDRLLALLGARDLVALRAGARLRPTFGLRTAFELSPAPGHPARAAIHNLAVTLDADTGEILRLVLTETGGDVVTLTLSDHQRTP